MIPVYSLELANKVISIKGITKEVKMVGFFSRLFDMNIFLFA